jgi:hypothetical protein
MGTIVIVTGSRDWVDRYRLFEALGEYDPVMVVQGGAQGADQIAIDWCSRVGRVCVTHFPDYQLGTTAPLIRNIQMLDTYPNAIVLAFPMLNSKGTRHTMRHARLKHMRMEVYNG